MKIDFRNTLYSRSVRNFLLSVCDFSLSQWIDISISKIFCILTGFLILNLPEISLALEKIHLEVQVLNGNIHFEFKGRNEWDYEIERKELEGRSFLEFRIAGLSESTGDELKKISSNDIVSSASLLKSPGEGKDTIIINLTSGTVEHFDYLTEKPSKLLLDLYQGKEFTEKPLAKKTEEMKEENKKTKEKLSLKTSSKQIIDPKSGKDIKPDRAPAEENTNINTNNSISDETEKKSGSVGIFDGDDPNFSRFSIRDEEIKEESIVRSQENLYIPFPMLSIEGAHFEEIKSTGPVYEVEPKETDENKMAQLVLTLFEKNRLGVALKTAKWLLEKYPKSKYKEIIKFVVGDIYYKFWERDNSRVNYETAIQSYREALNEFPNSILAPRTNFIIGYSFYQNKDYFGSLRTFQQIVTSQKPSVIKDKAQLAMARSLMRLNQFPEAIKIYEALEKEGFSESNRVEASFLKGDVFYMENKYKEASDVYLEAAKKYPKFKNLYPNSFYNLAESFFWQKKYKESLNSYRDFLAGFPRNQRASYAMTRAGECMEILGSDSRRVMGAFLETYFRYGGTEGAAVARIRILSNRMKQMKPKESERAIEEIKKISSEVLLPQIDLFATIMIAEGLSQRQEFERSIDTLLKWYQTNSTTRDATLIRKRIVRHVNEKMEGDVEKGDFLAALKLHNQYGELWLKGSGRIDTVYNLGRAFEQAGAYKESDILFRETINLLAAAKNSKQGREHSVFEHLPTLDQAFLRLAKVNKELGQSSKTDEYLKEIKAPDKMNSAQQIERMEIAVQLMIEKDDINTAKIYLRNLIDNWKGHPSEVVTARTKLAELEFKSKNYQKAADLLQANFVDLEDGKQIPSEKHLESEKLLSDVYLQWNKIEENQKILNDMTEIYKDKPSIKSYVFRFGKLYFDQGNIQKARDIWQSLDETKDSFWSGLAKDHLKDKEWKDDYKRYIQRIPAMAKPSEKGIK